MMVRCCGRTRPRKELVTVIDTLVAGHTFPRRTMDARGCRLSRGCRQSLGHGGHGCAATLDDPGTDARRCRSSLARGICKRDFCTRRPPSGIVECSSVEIRRAATRYGRQRADDRRCRTRQGDSPQWRPGRRHDLRHRVRSAMRRPGSIEALPRPLTITCSHVSRGRVRASRPGSRWPVSRMRGNRCVRWTLSRIFAKSWRQAMSAPNWISDRLPLSAGDWSRRPDRNEHCNFALGGGDDYELCFTLQESEITRPILPGEVTAIGTRDRFQGTWCAWIGALLCRSTTAGTVTFDE